MRVLNPERIAVIARGLSAAAALLAIMMYGAVACVRMRYPFELEWMEGAMADCVARVASGQKLYLAPSPSFVPFIYPPLYFYVVAPVWRLFGPNLFALRLVSFSASLVCLVVIYDFVRRETGERRAGLLAAGLYAACFELGAGFYDLGRVDSLFLALALAGAHALRFARGRGGLVGAALLFTLAFLAKQLALLVGLPLLAHAALARGRRGVFFAAGTLALGLAATAAIDLGHQSWYTYFAFKIPYRHSIEWDRMEEVLFGELGGALPIAALCCSAAAVDCVARLIRARRAPGWGWLFYPCLVLGMLYGSLVARLHWGGARNAFHPACAAIAIASGWAAANAWRRLAATASPSARVFGEFAVAALVLGQFYLLRYDPRAQLPTARDRAAGERLVARLAALPGEVVIPYHGQLARMAGKAPSAHQMAVTDLYRGAIAYWDWVEDEIERDLRRGRFAAVVLDFDNWHRSGLAARYIRQAAPPIGDDRVFWPVTGLHTRPNILYLRRTTAAPEAPAAGTH